MYTAQAEHGIDWGSMRYDRNGEFYRLFVDHYAIECRFQMVLEHLVMYSITREKSKETPAQAGIATPPPIEFGGQDSAGTSTNGGILPDQQG